MTPGERASTLNLMSNSSPPTDPASNAASFRADITSGWAGECSVCVELVSESVFDRN